MRRIFFLATAATAFLQPLAAEAACLSAEEAQKHAGENTCVCGVVASVHYAPQTKRQVTFLNLDKPFPNQIFTGVIFGGDRPKFLEKFGEPEGTLLGKRICVTGAIQLYRERPEIILRAPGQLTEERP